MITLALKWHFGQLVSVIVLPTYVRRCGFESGFMSMPKVEKKNKTKPGFWLNQTELCSLKSGQVLALDALFPRLDVLP